MMMMMMKRKEWWVMWSWLLWRQYYGAMVPSMVASFLFFSFFQIRLSEACWVWRGKRFGIFIGHNMAAMLLWIWGRLNIFSFTGIGWCMVATSLMFAWDWRLWSWTGHENGNNSGNGGHYLIIWPTTVANVGIFQIGANGTLGRSKTHFLFFLADTPQQCHWKGQLCCCYWRWQWWWYSFSLLFHMANNANFGIITCGDIGRADQFFHFLNVEYIDMILVVISFFPIWLANKVYLGLVLAVLLVGINNLSGKYMAMLPMGFYFFYTIGW